MPPLLHISGPVRCYISMEPPNFSPTQLVGFRQLGTCEYTPSYSLTVAHKAIENPIAGANPLDETMEGFSMNIEVVLTNYDALLFRQMQQHLSHNRIIGEYSAYKDVGYTTYGVETFQLVLKNTFFGTPNSTFDDSPGYLFYAASFAGSTPTSGGTIANKIGILFNCRPVYIPLTTNTYTKSSGTFKCYAEPTIIATLPNN